MLTNNWQLFDHQGRPIESHGATKQEIGVMGLLHGAAHVWLWRAADEGIEMLLQKRAVTKVSWPGRLDKSAGGHIKFGENPTYY